MFVTSSLLDSVHINRVLAFGVMVSTKQCCYGTCSNDSRYASKPEMQGVFFVPFPKCKTCPDKCQRWSRACCREGFDVASISRNTYMCSKHFVGGNGPTKDHPDPLPGTATSDKASAW